MQLESVKPNTQHTSINMYRDPVKNKLPAGYTMNDRKDDLQKNVDILFDTFLESYNDYKAGKMTKKMDAYCKIAGIPDSSQYKAFHKFVQLFEKEELFFLDKEDFYYYDMMQVNNEYQIAMFEFIENIIKFDFTGREKKVVFVFGSFWKGKPEIRTKFISYFEILCKKGFEIELYTNAKETEDQMDKVVQLVSKKSYFGLQEGNRVPIHFILAGDDYVLLEFPHTEEVIVRLDMFIDLNTAEAELKQKKTKTDIVLFFDNLIKEVVNKDAQGRKT